MAEVETLEAMIITKKKKDRGLERPCVQSLKMCCFTSMHGAVGAEYSDECGYVLNSASILCAWQLPPPGHSPFYTHGELRILMHSYCVFIFVWSSLKIQLWYAMDYTLLKILHKFKAWLLGDF